MQITVNDKNDIKVIAFTGNLETNTAPDAEEEINALIENGAKKILINFENLGYISSAGLRVLLKTSRSSLWIRSRISTNILSWIVAGLV